MAEENNSGSQMTPTSGDNKTALAAIAYIGPLVIISYLACKDDPFVKFHIKQGLVLFTIEVVISILWSAMSFFWVFFNLVNLAAIVLSVIGIMNVVNNREKELPIIGGLSGYFKF